MSIVEEEEAEGSGRKLEVGSSSHEKASTSEDVSGSEEDKDHAEARQHHEHAAVCQDLGTQKPKRQKLALSAMEAANKKGVIYMSRIPPHLKPLKLRHILSKYGEVGRLYLAPEDPSMRKRRKKLQGSSGKMFSEGWIEFTDKTVAKQVAGMLNGHPMGGKKRSAYHYDLWCLKYLPKFKWDHLTEEIAYQNAVREQKLANEISAAKRERDFYMSRVDRAKAEEAKDLRRKRKAEKEDGHEMLEDKQQSRQVMRTFGQKIAKPCDPDDAKSKSLPNSVLALLAGKTSQ